MSPVSKPRRILIKISGESLSDSKATGNYSQSSLMRTAQILADAHHDKIEIAVVCGGGNIMRGKILTSDNGMHQADADKIGMLATVMNVLVLKSYLEKIGVEIAAFSSLPIAGTIAEFNRNDAINALKSGKITLLAGGLGTPYFTTDTTAIVKGLELDCEYVIKATKVDGVYDSDPAQNPNAKHYPHLDYATAIEKKLAIMDSTAFTLARENGLKIIVMRLEDKNMLQNFSQDKDANDRCGKYTIISDEGSK